MIVDTIPLSGRNAYFIAANDDINLASANTVEVSYPAREDGEVLEIDGIQLLLQHDDLPSLLQRRDEPVLSFHIGKELFPGLIKDPYKHRVFTIAGFEDLSSGELNNCRAMEIDGVTTLVSAGPGACSWKSTIYPMPKPISVSAAAWDLAASKLSYEHGFSYGLMLNAWKPGDDVSQPPTQQVPLATLPRYPSSDRMLDPVPPTSDPVSAFQLEFSAQVSIDTYVQERYGGVAVGEKLGRPLLRSVHLVEPIEPLYAFYSLQELLRNASSYHLFEETAANPTRLSLTVDISASLEEGEKISIEVPGGLFSRVEARLSAELHTRPPRTT